MGVYPQSPSILVACSMKNPSSWGYLHWWNPPDILQHALPQQLSHIPQLATPFRSIEGTTQEHRRAPSGAIKAGLFRVAPSQLMLDQETEEKHHQGQGLRVFEMLNFSIPPHWMKEYEETMIPCLFVWRKRKGVVHGFLFEETLQISANILKTD